MKNKIVTAYQNQILVAFIVCGGIIVAAAVFLFALVRIVCVEAIARYRPLIRPVAERLSAFRQPDNVAQTVATAEDKRMMARPIPVSSDAGQVRLPQARPHATRV